MEWDRLPDSEAEPLGVCVAAEVGDGETVGVTVLKYVTLLVRRGVKVSNQVTLCDTVGVSDVETVRGGVGVPVLVGAGVPEEVGERVRVTAGVNELVGERVEERVGDRVTVREALSVT